MVEKGPYRRGIIFGFGVLVVLASVIGFSWVLSIASVLPGAWATVLNAILMAITTVATVSTLFSLLSLWPDFKREARREMEVSIQEYRDLLDEYRRGLKVQSTREVVNERVRAASNMRRQASLAGFTGREVRAYLRSHDEGERLAGLCMVQWQGKWLTHESHKRSAKHLNKLYNRYLGVFDSLLAVLLNPVEPFEHYQAIEAMRSIFPYLNPQQMQELCREVFSYEFNTGRTSTDWHAFVTMIREKCSE